MGSWTEPLRNRAPADAQRCDLLRGRWRLRTVAVSGSRLRGVGRPSRGGGGAAGGELRPSVAGSRHTVLHEPQCLDAAIARDRPISSNDRHRSPRPISSGGRLRSGVRRRPRCRRPASGVRYRRPRSVSAFGVWYRRSPPLPRPFAAAEADCCDRPLLPRPPAATTSPRPRQRCRGARPRPGHGDGLGAAKDGGRCGAIARRQRDSPWATASGWGRAPRP